MKYPTKYTYVEFTYTNESGKEVNAKHEIIGRYTKDKVLQALKSMYNDSVKIDFCGILDWSPKQGKRQQIFAILNQSA